METPKPEKKPRPLSKPTTRELLLCENYYNTWISLTLTPMPQYTHTLTKQIFKLSQIYKLKVLLTRASKNKEPRFNIYSFGLPLASLN